MLIIQQSAAKGALPIPGTVDFIINETIPQTLGELIFSCHKGAINIHRGVVVHLLTMKNPKNSTISPKPQEETILNQFCSTHNIELK